MSKRLLHVCQICGKKFATPKGVCGHQRMHSGLQRNWGLKDSRVCSVSMTENEKHEVIEAAINLVMISQQVYDFAAIRNLLIGDVDDSLDLELKALQEKILDRNELKLDDFSDGVVIALPCALRSKLQKKTQCSSYKCNVCDKSFSCSQAFGGHQRLHRSNKEKLACRKKEVGDDNSLLQSSSIEVSQEKQILHCDKKIVSQPSSLDVSQESKLDFSEVLAHSGLGKSRRCSKTKFSPLRSTKSHSRYRFKICGKSFVCSQALSGHKTLHRSMKEQLVCTEDDNTLFTVTDVAATSFKTQGI